MALKSHEALPVIRIMNKQKQQFNIAKFISELNILSNEASCNLLVQNKD